MARKIMRDVKRSVEFEELYNRLGNREYKWPEGRRPNGAPLFGTIRELLCFAAFLGFYSERRESLQGCQTDSVPEEVFAKNEDALEIVRIIALAERKDQAIFEEDKVEEMVTIFEEYAHGGMKIIQRFILDLPTDVLGADAIIAGLRKEGILDKRDFQGETSSLNGVEF